MTSRPMRALLPVAVVAFLAACETPEELRTLADRTAANVGVISAHLQRLERNSQDIAEFRADNISRLHAVNAEMRARYEYDIELTKRSGGASVEALIGQIAAWRDKVQEIFAKADGAEQERRQQILATQTRLDKKTKALTEISQSLAALAKEDKPADRVRFLKGYAKDLKSELERVLNSDDETAEAAKSLIGSVSTKIGPVN